MQERALLDSLLELQPDDRAEVFRRLPPAVARAARYAWRGLWARPDQLAPGSVGAAPAIRGRPGLVDLFRSRALPSPEHSADWSTWILLGGRGSGKTRTGAEQVVEWAKRGPQPPIYLVGATAADVRDVMVCPEPQPGQSGIIAISEPGFVPRWVQSRRAGKLIWPNGVVAYGFSAEEPDRLRGPQGEKAWADDVAAWKHTTRDASWDMLQFGLRVGQKPQVVVTTTPKPVPWLIGGRGGTGAMGVLNDPTTMVTVVRTDANRHNLAEAYLSKVVRKYEGTRLGRQELNAEILGDVEGALWTMGMIDALRMQTMLAGVELRRIAVAIDPQASEGTGDDTHPEGPETGIVVGGVGACACKGEDKIEDHGFILEDISGNWSPNAWAKKAVRAYNRHQADRIIAEKNNGGAMVEHTIRTVDTTASFEAVWASRGKRPRAEPVAALYEQGKVHHVGPATALASLDDQLSTWTGGLPSPNRLDALVWCVSYLMLGSEETGAAKFYRYLQEEGG